MADAAATTRGNEAEGLRRLHEEWLVANATLDVDAMRRFLAQDCRYFDANGSRYDGIEAILELEGSFRSVASKHPDAPGDQLAIFDYAEPPVVTVDGNVGWVTFLATLRGILAGQEIAIPMRGTEIFHRRDGEWRMVHGHFSSTAPALSP